MAKQHSGLTLWLREEDRTTERRTPLLPEGAKTLMADGIDVVVEKSSKRSFSNAMYKEAGCTLVEAGTWVNAPKNAIILGLKELPETPKTLVHTHIYFAHAFKDQSGWQDKLARFQTGGGSLLDIEYMTEDSGRRVAAFGYWAGYMGAALALLQWQDRKAGRPSLISDGLSPFRNASALDGLITSRAPIAEIPRALVIGAGGRCGHGAAEILERHGVKVTKWGRRETGNINRAAIRDHDILINCAFVEGMIPPFLTPEHLVPGQRLRVISDVSCDPLSEFNPLPLYGNATCWDAPAISITDVVDLIAVDNLPSLLPNEASIEFAGLLLPFLRTLPNRKTDPVWKNCDKAFQDACRTITECEVA